MPKRRLLPEVCYDFWTRDSRDGATSARRDSLIEVRADQRYLRKLERDKGRPWAQCCIEIWWEVNERKVLKRFAPTPKRSTGAP